MSVTDSVYALNEFYLNYVETSVPVQVFQSFTYGEMVISVLLLCCLVLYVMKWLWEVLR